MYAASPCMRGGSRLVCQKVPTVWSHVDIEAVAGKPAEPQPASPSGDRDSDPVSSFFSRLLPQHGEKTEQTQHHTETESARAPVFSIVAADAQKNAEGVEFFRRNKEDILNRLKKNGSVWFRGFDLMKNEAGFMEFYSALGLLPCLDPIHSSGLRKMVAPKQAVYETVNKASLSKHYVGMHNESTFKKSAALGAFVCFKPAEKGGEFLLADGAEILKRLDPQILRELADRKVRISVTNLDFPFLESIPEPFKATLKEWMQGLIAAAVAPKFDMELEMVWGADGTPHRLQAIEPAQSPVNSHPFTRLGAWFCNLHNHSRYLRDRRPCAVPEVGMTDVYFGDLTRIPPSVVEHVDRVTRDCIVEVPMQKGDVVLVDNYRTLHGRNIFDGERMHTVTWFRGILGSEGYFGVEGGEEKQEERGTERGSGYDFAAGDALNEAINKLLVK
uniref:TauD/TfdA-like domain-containing protein n=1 Tax=Chromera velia CCMP2878 TaxID=1169474 RepID=A0A0G4HE32_9ALVE|eukprot:Cvel_26499.t1-p1 / transcript=Cvel_26499.t1 / gene=Cvel_26499 / organism=Chromera_velia_CCMP2878 / gene_product=hypothetical protein / transcript_product=hypothetical protein / location=Cvel_scaffold3160:5744-8806(+) / protein_length=443 / sequence_SO=supercontig / SO=protein_coding / is_pseudo=false